MGDDDDARLKELVARVRELDGQRPRRARGLAQESFQESFSEPVRDPAADRKRLERVLASDEVDRGLEVLADVREGKTPVAKNLRFLEAIVEATRPVLLILQDAVQDPDEMTRSWDEPVLRRLIRATGCLDGQSFDQPVGTVFLIAPDHVLTNRHVAAMITKGQGVIREKVTDRLWIDFFREHGRPEKTRVRVAEVVMVHPYWDAAVLRLESVPDGREPLALATGPAPRDSDICVVGYPMKVSNANATLQTQVFKGVFGVKRFLPGKLRGRVDWENVNALDHDASTLGGNSGSPVFDPRRGAVLGLHFGGEYKRFNAAVPSWELLADPRFAELKLVEAKNVNASPVADAVAMAWRKLEGGAVVQTPAAVADEPAKPPTTTPPTPALAADAPDVVLIGAADGDPLATRWRARGYTVHTPSIDGGQSLDDAADRLHHALEAIRIQRPGRRLVLVACGAAGLAAATYSLRQTGWREAVSRAVLIATRFDGDAPPGLRTSPLFERATLLTDAPADDAAIDAVAALFAPRRRFLE